MQPSQRRRVVLLCEELPVAGQNGYSTYNRAFMRYFLDAGDEVHLIVTGGRFPSPLFKASEMLQAPDAIVHTFGTARMGDWHLALGPGVALRALLRWIDRMTATMRAAGRGGGAIQGLIRLWRNRPAAHRTAVVGRFLDAADLHRVFPLLKALNPDVVLVDTLFRADAVRELPESAWRILIAHDVFHKRCMSLARRGLRVVPYVTLEEERAVLTRFDSIVAISTDDARDFLAMQPGVHVVTVTAAGPQRTVPAGPMTIPQGNRIFYLGSRAHHNVDGLRWFLDTIWPRVIGVRPDLILDVVGTVGAEIRNGMAGVVVHGPLEQIAPVATAALFAINPVRAGSGMKIKMLDYFAHDLPCVTTTVGAQGFPGLDSAPIAVCDTPDEFAQTILDWCGDHRGLIGRRTIARHYSERFSFRDFAGGVERALRPATLVPDWGSHAVEVTSDAVDDTIWPSGARS